MPRHTRNKAAAHQNPSLHQQSGGAPTKPNSTITNNGNKSSKSTFNHPKSTETVDPVVVTWTPILDKLNAISLQNPTENVGWTMDTLTLVKNEIQLKSVSNKTIRMEILLAIKEIMNKSDESSPNIENIYDLTETIIELLTIKDKKEGSVEITIGQCRQMLDDIVTAYKSKWKLQKQLGHPDLMAKNSNVNKKLLKSLPKHEASILKALSDRWTNFESRLEKSYPNDMQNALQCMFQQFQQVQQSLGIWKPPALPLPSSSAATDDRTEDPTISCAPTKRIFMNETYKCESQPSVAVATPSPAPSSPPPPLPQKSFDDCPNKDSTSSVSSSVYQQPQPLPFIDEKHFKDIDLLPQLTAFMTADHATGGEQLIAIQSNQECYINFGKIWTGDSRWLSVKHNLVQRGVMKANGLYISLPIYRKEFYIGQGNFGAVEFAFSKNFHAIALKRLTESGQLTWDRCDGIRQCIESMDKVSAGQISSHPNLARMTFFQDMCGYSFMYSRLADYNLDEYLRLLESVDATAEGADELRRMDLPVRQLRILEQIVAGLQALHSYRPVAVVHGNLKPNNILVDQNGTVRLAEFGIYKFLYEDGALNVRSADKLWWPREILNWHKLLNAESCTTMSDIYTCGLIFVFVHTGGRHPNENSTMDLLKFIKSEEQFPFAMDLSHLLEQMLLLDPHQRLTINEVRNHIYFWSPQKRSEFLQTCISVANTDFAPFFVERQMSQSFCATLEQIWATENTKMYWMAAAFIHFRTVQVPYGARIDSAMGLLKFLGKCKNDDLRLYEQPGLIGLAYPDLACTVFNALSKTPWLLHDKFKAFSPLHTAAAAGRISDDDAGVVFDEENEKF